MYHRFGRSVWDITVVSSSLLQNLLCRNRSSVCLSRAARFSEFGGKSTLKTLKMGSINCKEYKTAKNPACAQESGDTGSYKFRPESDMDDVEAVVCNDADINENEMKQLDFDENTKILLVKQKGKLHAIGSKCTHYGAPLHTGALGDGQVRCPWHGACFNITSGDIEDCPGLDSLPCFKVHVEKDGKVKVRAKKSQLEKNKRVKDMVFRNETDARAFVVIGGGPSAGACVEALRQENYTGRIIMICQENALPYDRVKLSKVFDVELQTLQFRDSDFYNKYSIETILGTEATQLNTTDKLVSCSNGEEVKYDKLFIATGSRAIKPKIPGVDLENVVTIRNYEDAQAIKRLISKDLDVVCLGTGFIGMEAASALVKKVKSVTVIGRDAVPFKHIFGEQIGERVLKLFRENNVNMILNSGIKECRGKDGVLTEVELTDGTVLPCGLCVMGTGSRFNTEFLKDSGIEMNAMGAVNADSNLMTNIPDVYVGGDIANAPLSAGQPDRVSISHFQIAQYHGRVAAANMAGQSKSLRTVPFFWTTLFNKGFRYSGSGKNTEIKIVGSVDELKFVAFLMNEDGKVVASTSCGYDPVVAQYAEYTLTQTLHKNDIESEDPLAWTKSIIRPMKV